MGRSAVACGGSYAAIHQNRPPYSDYSRDQAKSDKPEPYHQMRRAPDESHVSGAGECQRQACSAIGQERALVCQDGSVYCKKIAHDKAVAGKLTIGMSAAEPAAILVQS